MGYPYTARWEGDQVEQMRTMLDSFQNRIWTAMPGIIEEVNSDNTVDVQITIKQNIEGKDGSIAQTPFPLLVKCPVLFPGGGGYLATFPIQNGDEVLVIFASRCIDAWWQSGGVQAQMETRAHDLSDGFVIPKLYSVPKLPTAAISTTTAQLRSFDGSVYAEVDQPNGQVHFKAPTQVLVDAPLLKVNGKIEATGDVIAGQGGTNISALNHDHTYIPGSGTPTTTSPPVAGS